MSHDRLKTIDLVAQQLGYNTKTEPNILSRLIPMRSDEQPAKPTNPKYVIGVDFDGTVVTHEFPHIGKDLPYCVEVLKKLVANNAGIILHTMRSGKPLDDAAMWFYDRGIPLYGININPTQHEWTMSPKPYCNLFIDDAALGCPLKYEPSFAKRPYVDWKEVDYFLKHHHYYVEPIIKP